MLEFPTLRSGPTHRCAERCFWQAERPAHAARERRRRHVGSIDAHSRRGHSRPAHGRRTHGTRAGVGILAHRHCQSGRRHRHWLFPPHKAFADCIAQRVSRTDEAIGTPPMPRLELSRIHLLKPSQGCGGPCFAPSPEHRADGRRCLVRYTLSEPHLLCRCDDRADHIGAHVVYSGRALAAEHAIDCR